MFLLFRCCLLLCLLFSPALACSQGSCVLAGPRIASVDSTRGALLNALLGGLLNSSLNLNVLDWQALATSDLNLNAYLNALSTRLGVSNPDQALQAQASLLQALSAASAVAQADNNTALISALNTLQTSLPAISAPIRVGDLLDLEFPEGALSDTRINALNLVTGLIQLYNYRNVVTTPTPVTLSGAALGLGSVINSAQLWFQVVEPPIYTCGPQNASFHTAAMRVKQNLNLVNQVLDTSALNAALGSALGANVTSSASLSSVQLYAELARADGSITFLDALSQTVTLQATPGVADLYLGSLPDALFFNRNHAIVPEDVGFGTAGTLNIRVTAPATGAVLADSSVGLQLRSTAKGDAPFNSSASVSAPFPKTVIFSTSSVFIADLAASLSRNLELRFSGSLGPLLDPQVNGVILPNLKPVVASALVPVLSAALGGVLDPVLEILGIGLGEAVFQVTGVAQACSSLSLTKQVRNVTRGGTFGLQGEAAPGDTLEYCLDYVSSGALDVTQLVLRDTLDSNLDPLPSVAAYQGGALWLNGQPLSAAPDADAGEYQGQSLTVRVGTVPAGASGRLCFQATLR